MGTVSYAGPEYLDYRRKKERDEKGDIFSFGVIAWELFTREIPWQKEEYLETDIFTAVLQGERLEIPESIIIRKLIQETWNDSKSFHRNCSKFRSPK